MFIAPTARRFGLTVDANRDDRLDVAAETDAAIRMLSGLYRQFGACMSAANSDALCSLSEDGPRARSAMSTSLEPQRSAGIDVLRGLCVLLVTLHHIHLRFKFNRFDVKALLPEPVARVVFWSGDFAVITFFVISGFLITTLSLRRWTSLDRISWRQFHWLRFARIAPCLLLLVLMLSVLHLAQANGFVIPGERSSLGRAVLAALTFHVDWLEGHHGYLPGGWDVLWSLSVEEVFYLSFPAMCLGLRSVRGLLVPLFRSSVPSRGLHQAGLGISVLELGAALVLIALSQGIGSTVLARGTGLMRGVGRCSYEIYLTHMLVIVGLMPFITASKPETAWLPVWYVALLLSSVALGWVVHHVYSEPLNRALRSRHRSPIDERAVQSAAAVTACGVAGGCTLQKTQVTPAR